MQNRGRPPQDPGEPPAGGAFGALRHRDFRLLWSGAMISSTGGWMQQVAQAWLIYELTGSPLLVGLNGLIRTVPFLGMSLYAGAVIDRMDRRKILCIAEVVQLVITLIVTALIASGHVEIWHIYASSVFSSLAGAFEIPAQQSLLPHLVPRRDLMTAISLNSLIRKGTQILGPALGGVCVAAFGVAATYFLNAVGYGVLILMILLMRTTHITVEGEAPNPLRAIADGLRYVRSEAIIGTLLLQDAVMSVFGSYNAMLVVFAVEVLNTGPEGFGLLQSAPGIGTVVGSIVLSTIGDIKHKGRLIFAGGIAYSLFVIGFALSRSYPVALLFLTLAGFADVTVGSTRTTVLQLYSRRNMLGRVTSLQAMATRGLGPVGGFQAGSIGTLIGVPAAIALGGGVCLLTVLTVARYVPALRNFTGEGRREETASAGHDAPLTASPRGERPTPVPDPAR